jgi:hypothetical protein
MAALQGRNAMILALLVRPGARAEDVSADDVARLAAQFGVPTARVNAMILSLLSDLRSARSTLDSCQPRDVRRCPKCNTPLAAGEPCP